MKIYGYIRVSTDQQNCANQHHEIDLFCKANNLVVTDWIEEIISSRKKLKDRKLGKLLKKIQNEDILITTEISRLGRSMLEVMGILQKCLEKECQIWTIKENYRLGSDIQSKVLAFSFSLASEIERQLISQRTKQSLKRIKDEGKHLGRPYGFKYTKLLQKHTKITKMLNDGNSKYRIAKTMDCSWITVHNYIRKNIKQQIS